MSIVIFAVLAAIIAVWAVLRYLRRPQIGHLHLYSGGVKTGKTAHSVKTCLALIRKQRKKARKAKAAEMPMLYSNMPIRTKQGYKPLKLEHIKLEKRFEAGSVIYINEASLLAGSKDIRDEEVNDELLRFYKLCAHLTHGGYVVVDTQNPADNHYTCKRSLSSYWHILQTVKIPHIGLLSIVERRIIVDEDTASPAANDQKRDKVRELVENLLPRTVFVRFCPWSVLKRYDQYAYSTITDSLPTTDDEPTRNAKNLKQGYILRLKGAKKR